MQHSLSFAAECDRIRH